MLDPKDANKIIDSFLSPMWYFVASQEDKDEIHRLADEPRKAAGLIGGAASDDQQPYLSFPVISDIHVQAWDSEAKRKFAAALVDLHEVNPSSDALIVNGDLADGKVSDYAGLTALMAGNPHPPGMFFTIGNHDYYKAYYDQTGSWSPATFPNGETEQASIGRFLAFAQRSRVYADAWVKGHHFIFLGSEQYRQSNPDNREDAYLSAAQLEWLKAALADNYVSGRAIFVFLHQPLQGTVSGSIPRGAVQGAELRSILSLYPEVILFTGHTHWELRLPGTLVREAFTMVNSSSVYQPYGAGDQPLEGEHSEGLYVEVYVNRVLIRGRDFAGKRWIPEAQYTIEMK